MPASSTTAVPGSTADADVSFFTYVREVVSGAATLLQEAPLAVATEAAGLVQEVPIVGIVCKTFLSLEQLVETAKSNKDDLADLRDLCDVVINDVLDKRPDRSSLREGFAKLKDHVDRAENVAKLCRGASIGDTVKKSFLARKISKDIASIRNDVLAFCTVNTLVLSNDIHVRTAGGSFICVKFIDPSVKPLAFFFRKEQ